jgi:cellulose synthase/poly-beta-1,6-N-acetylglucosamine synthase-like glycosyltransferase
MNSTTKFLPDDSLAGVRLGIFLLLAPIFIKYAIQLFTTPFYSLLGRFRKAGMESAAEPLVSVLIPAWNEEVGILKTINSVLATQYKNLEVIVINDGSTDATHDLVTGFIQNYGVHGQPNEKIKYLCLSNGGKANALNQGLMIADGEIIITIDADSVMDKSAIVNIVKQFTDNKVAAVAGNVIVGNRKKPIELLQQLEYLYGFFFKRADSAFNSVYIIGGAAAAYRKNVLMELGGFDHDIITEDIEMSTRILAHGYKTRYAADAVVYTEGPSSWSGLCNQRLRWKHGRLLTFIKHRKLFFSCQKQHSPYLTFLLLPIAVYAEFALLFEAVLLFLFYGYTIHTNDYLPLVILIVFISTVILLQIAVDAKSRFHRNLLVLAPVAWIVFYIIDVVEFQALCRSIKRLATREKLQWQKWQRVGLLNPMGGQPPAGLKVATETK